MYSITLDAINIWGDKQKPATNFSRNMAFCTVYELIGTNRELTE